MKDKLVSLLVFQIILFFYSLNSFAVEVDPFAGDFSYIKPTVSSSATSLNEDEIAIPSQRYKLNKYFVKGIVTIVGSPSKSFAVISYYPGGQDYVLQKSQPLGNESHVITKITTNYIVVKNNDGETREIPVQNLSPSLNSATNMGN